MVSPDFSEFQFAYGVTKELEESLGSDVITPPVFPTQNQEEEVGSDVIMGIQRGNRTLAPLFIQYKRSSRMIRPWANEWNDFGQEYFRFSFHTANQHNTLVDMAQHGVACYLAPGFHTREEYVRNHRNQEIAENSVIVRAETIGRVNSGDHRIAYTVNPLHGFFYSEPSSFEPTRNIYSLIDEVWNENVFQGYDSLRGEFRELRSQLVEEMDLSVEGYFEGDGPREWIRNQQRFFFEVANTQLTFLEREQ